MTKRTPKATEVKAKFSAMGFSESLLQQQFLDNIVWDLQILLKRLGMNAFIPSRFVYINNIMINKDTIKSHKIH